MDTMFSSVWARRFMVAALGLLALFLLVKTVSELKGIKYIGQVADPKNIITVTGEGETYAVPDTATFNFSVMEKAKTVAEAQTAATKRANDAIDYLKKQGIEDKSIKTINYSINPTYEYEVAAACARGYCPPGRQVLSGYEVNQTIEVKTKDTAKAGDLLSGLGSLNVSNLSGLSFTVDNEDALKREARQKAINVARENAEALARDLGVNIGRIVNFSENNNYPIYYGKAALGMGLEAAQDSVAPSVPVPTGENKITSNVSITYEIE